MKIPKHYSLVKEHKDHFQLHDSRDNSTFNVARKGLEPKHQATIAGIPAFDDGGMMTPVNANTSTPDLSQKLFGAAASATPVETAPAPNAGPDVDRASLGNVNTSDAVFGAYTPPQESPSSVVAPTAVAPSPAAETPSPLMGPATPTGPEKYQQSENQVTSGMEAESKARQNQNLGEVKIRQDLAKESNPLRQRLAQMGTDVADIQKRNNTIESDIAKQEFKPYWEGLGTGGKFSTAIGVVMGGLGQALMHSNVNAAMQVMEKQMDQDLERQKADLGKKNSLLSENYRRLGDLHMAMHDARMQMESQLNGALALNAAKYNNPIIATRTQQLVGERKIQMMPMEAQLAQMQLKKDVMSGKVGNVTPEDRINVLADTPQEREEAGKQLTAVKNHASEQSSLLSAFDRVAKENTYANRASSFGRETPAMREFKILAMPFLKDEAGKISDIEMERMDHILSRVGEGPDTIKALRSGLVKMTDSKQPQSNLLRKFGIDKAQFHGASAQPKFKEGPIK